MTLLVGKIMSSIRIDRHNGTLPVQLSASRQTASGNIEPEQPRYTQQDQLLECGRPASR
jgi:hypothetical protein